MYTGRFYGFREDFANYYAHLLSSENEEDYQMCCHLSTYACLCMVKGMQKMVGQQIVSLDCTWRWRGSKKCMQTVRQQSISHVGAKLLRFLPLY